MTEGSELNYKDWMREKGGNISLIILLNFHFIASLLILIQTLKKLKIALRQLYSRLLTV